MRGFEKVSINEFLKTRNVEEYEKIILPRRGTQFSAGYDFYTPYGITIKAGEKEIIATGIKAYMQSNEVLLLVIRSSLGFKHSIRLINQVGVIDSDYYNNVDNEGHILIGLENKSNEDVILKANDRIAQGIFINYLIANDEDKPLNHRIGGIGSTKNN